MSSSRKLEAINLDQPDSYLPLDSGGMVPMTLEFAAQCRKAISIGDGFVPPASFAKTEKVVLSGLGGSAIAGDLVNHLTEDSLSVPLQVNRQYDLPAWVNQKTLVVLSSYSGNTEETISAFQQAMQRKAQAVCITSGGKLTQLAGENEVPVIKIPGGQPPRASTGYLIFPFLAVLEKSGLAPSFAEGKEETTALLETMSKQLAPEKPTAENDAKNLALWLKDKFALVYGSGLLTPVALRWQTQLNENSKVLAHAGQLPEMNHNEVVAWAHHSALSEKMAAVLLRYEQEPPRIRARYELTKRIITDHSSVREYWSKGKSRLACQLSLVYLADVASLYLAFLNRKDPIEINAINFLKGELAKLS